MDIETINRWLGSVAFLVSIISVISVWVGAPWRKMADALDKFRDDLKNHDRRIQAVENEIKHLPTSDEFSALQMTVTKVEGDVKRIEGTLDRVENVVGRIDDYLRCNK